MPLDQVAQLMFGAVSAAGVVAGGVLFWRNSNKKAGREEEHQTTSDERWDRLEGKVDKIGEDVGELKTRVAIVEDRSGRVALVPTERSGR